MVNVTSISRTEATALARRIHANGGNATTIAKALKEAGFVSERTGNPLTAAGAYYLAFYAKRRSRMRQSVKRPSVSAPTTGGGNGKAKNGSSLSLIRMLLQNEAITAQDRISLALLTIDTFV